MEISVADIKLDDLDISTINALKINIINAKVRVNDTGANSKVENNIAGIKNALAISFANNCLKEMGEIGT